MQFRKKLLFSMVLSICKFGITYILPNKSWILWCFRSAELVVYSAYAQCMQRHASMAIRRPAARAIIHGARWCVVCAPFGVSGCAPSPPLPPGCRKNGRPLTGRAIRYDTQPFETSRQTSSRSTFNASLTHGKRAERVFNVFSVRSACVCHSTRLTERT